MPRVRSYDTVGVLSRSMGAAMLRHNVLANNIANADTPHFKRSDVDFQTRLRRALDESPRLELSRSSARHIPTRPTREWREVTPRIFNETDTFARNDKNNVNPEVEMARLAQNTLRYMSLTGRIRDRFQRLTQVVQRGGAPVG